MEYIMKNWSSITLIMSSFFAAISFIIAKRYFLSYFIDLLSVIFLLTALNIFTLTFPFIRFVSNNQYKSSEVVFNVLIALVLVGFVLITEIFYIRKVKNNFTLFKVNDIKGILKEKKNKKDKMKIKYIDEAQTNYSYKYLTYNIVKEITVYDKEKYVEKFYYTYDIYTKMKNNKIWKKFLIIRIILILISFILWGKFKFSISAMTSSYVLTLFLIVKNAILIPAIQKENRLAIEDALKNFK